MLQVGIHYRQIGRRRGKHSFDAGPREPASADAAYEAAVRMAGRELVKALERAVGGIVVDEDYFPVRSVDGLCDRMIERLDIVAFIQRRNDDRQFWADGRQMCFADLAVVSIIGDCCGGPFALLGGISCSRPVSRWRFAASAVRLGHCQTFER